MDENKISFRTMKLNEYEDAVVYRIPCDCQDSECDVILNFEIDKKINAIYITFYKTIHWSSYWMPKDKSWLGKLMFRIKESLKMLFTGHIQMQGDMVILDPKHIEAFEMAIKEGKEYLMKKIEENKKQNK